MDFYAFMADLEARATEVPEAEPIDDADYCFHCRKPLSKGRSEYRRVAHKEYCQLCYDMRDLISGRQHFVDAQDEYEEQQKQIKRLRTGGNYFEK